jgi:leucine dehydrogenase
MRAIVAIHDTRLGPALGGCRFVAYANEEAAFTDALRLARAMTSKAALAGLAHGGGKAVLVRPNKAFDRKALFARFGRFVDGLGGRYITTEDSGTSPDDMLVVQGATAHVCGCPVEHGGSGDPSPATALGVRRGIEACVRAALGRDSLQGVHVAVQGLGHVGYYLCKELAQLGATLTVADVVDELVQQAVEEFGAKAVAAAEIHRTECDVYAPCALGGALNDRTVPELRCRIVAGAANNQLASDRNGQMLVERGILYAPDYAINAGGLIHVALGLTKTDQAEVRDQVLTIHDTIAQISDRALKSGQPPHVIADTMVQERLDAAG